MASNTKKTKLRRKRKSAKAGKERKRVTKSKGSTPKFPIDPKEEKK